MKLKTLLNRLKIDKKQKAELKIFGSKEVNITGVSADTRNLAPGNLFLARKGKNFDGADFMEKAVKAGASCIASDLFNPFLKQTVQIVHPEISEWEAKLAAAYYNFPSEKLFAVGVTGTNGKTTVCYLIKHLLDQNKTKCGLLGTVEYITGKKHYPATLTTPSASSLQRFLREMKENKMQAAVLEASSQALDQKRCRHIDFDAAVFTNITQDHLDYHQSMQNYLLCKLELFKNLPEDKKAIVNLDDPSAEQVLNSTKAQKITFAINKKADLQADNIMLLPDKTAFDLIYQEKRVKITSSLIGRFNVYNILSAAAVALAYGLGLEKIASAINSFSSVKGRLEKVKTNTGFSVFVDFAHTEDALAKTLKTLSEIKKGRLITVFGCGGDRDRLKRPKMGKIAAGLSDMCIITSDNPRKEDPEIIMQQIAEGVKTENCQYIMLQDRFSAIEKAVQTAEKNDIVLIAGKGHETYQVFQDKTIFFDDKKAVEEICQKNTV